MCVEYMDDCGCGARSRENPVVSVFSVKKEFEREISLQLLSKGAESRARFYRKPRGPVNLTSLLAFSHVNPAGGTRCSWERIFINS